MACRVSLTRHDQLFPGHVEHLESGDPEVHGDPRDLRRRQREHLIRKVGEGGRECGCQPLPLQTRVLI